MMDLAFKERSGRAFAQDLVIHVIVYGILGPHNDVVLSLWDKKFQKLMTLWIDIWSDGQTLWIDILVWWSVAMATDLIMNNCKIIHLATPIDANYALNKS